MAFQFCRDRVVEKFVVGRSPERIIDDVVALQHGGLTVAARISLSEMRSTITEYSATSLMRVPQLTNSAATPQVAQLVHLHDEAGGKLYSRPQRKATSSWHAA